MKLQLSFLLSLSLVQASYGEYSEYQAILTKSHPVLVKSIPEATHLRQRQLQRPSCPDQQPCHDFGGGWYGYSISKVSADGTCHEYCAAGGSLTYYTQQQGYTCGKCPMPSCPDQQPCHDFGNGYLGYLVHTKNNDGSCRAVCSAGNSLAAKIASVDWECGACPKPSCPNQEPCADYGNGWLAYAVHQESEDGSCHRVCAVGSSLTRYRNQGYTCGECPEQEQPSCPDQDPCDQGTGWTAYSLFKMSEGDSSCTEVCASGSHITDKLQEGYVCGSCPEPAEQPTCPDQEPCAEGTGWKAFSLYQVGNGGTSCTEACVAGNYFTEKLEEGFVCGTCPDPQEPAEQPSCPDQEPCKEENGWTYYSLTKTEGTTCTEACAAGSYITEKLAEGYVCGTCPDPAEQPSCPDQEPCKEENGWTYYSLTKTEGSTCTEACAAGSYITEKLAEGYVCGTCPDPQEPAEQPSCPDQEPCKEENGWTYYSLTKTEGSTCTEVCAAGSYITEKLAEGFVCGTCPDPDDPAQQPSCPDQEPCKEENGWTYYSLTKTEGSTCTQACAAGSYITEKLAEGFVCGTCPEPQQPGEQPSCPDQTPCKEENGWVFYPLFKVSDNGYSCTQACAAGSYITEKLAEGFACGECPN